MAMGKVWSFASSILFEYETQKVVQINSKKIGAIFRLIQLGIILYVIMWVMYYERGYQSFDMAVSGVTAKLKGVAFANLSGELGINARVWDAADYVIPPQQNSAFFVMTNVVYTPNQQQGNCEESHDVYKIDCVHDSDCKAGDLVMLGSGVKTGKCVNSTRAKKRVCEIYGWCPTEYDVLPVPGESILGSVPNFTVLLKNSIEFPRYKVKRRNILSWMNKTFLKKCRYNPYDEEQKFCPIFRLGDILNYAEADNNNIWTRGGMVSIHITWNCNLDYSEEKCVPKYTFRRLDDFNSPVAKGWNFRYSHHYVENGTLKRTLIKAYGIQFFITVYGRGGKFDFLTFTMNLGSGLALLGIATVLCDMIVLNITRKRGMYRMAKVDTVTENEEDEPEKMANDDTEEEQMYPGSAEDRRKLYSPSNFLSSMYSQVTGNGRQMNLFQQSYDSSPSLKAQPPPSTSKSPPPLAERDSLSQSSGDTITPPSYQKAFQPPIVAQLKAIDDNNSNRDSWCSTQGQLKYLG